MFVDSGVPRDHVAGFVGAHKTPTLSVFKVIIPELPSH